MPRNPTTGTYTRPDNDFSEPVLGEIIDPVGADELFNDYDAALTDSLSRSGEGPMQADLDLGGHNVINGGTGAGFAIDVTGATGTLPIGHGGTGAATASTARTSLGVAIGTDVQAYDADLAALAANSSNGIWARTGAGTGAVRTITAPNAGISATNGDGVSGNPTIVASNDLASIEALSGTGFAVRTATDTWAQRTITGTAAEITVTNGDGVAGNPTASLPSAITLSGKTLSGGTLTGASVTGLPAPTLSSDAATKDYVDNVAGGRSFYTASIAATTTVMAGSPTYSNGTAGVGATITATVNGALSIDGVSPTVGQLILVKNQASALQNGEYAVTDAGSVSTVYIVTRYTGMDQPSEMHGGGTVFISGGTANANTQWSLSASVTTVGTDPLTFVQTGGAGNNTWAITGSDIESTNAGNIAIGAAPSPWNAAYKVMQANNTAFGSGSSDVANVVGNVYYDGSNWKYQSTDFAAYYTVNESGTFGWYTAPSGTAAATATLTKRMTLTQAGALGIGTATPASPLDVGAHPSGSYTAGTAAAFSAPADTASAVVVQRGGTSNPMQLYMGVHQSGTYAELQTEQANVGVQPLILQRQGGRVGIGTASPSALLEVDGDIFVPPGATHGLRAANVEIGNYGNRGADNAIGVFGGNLILQSGAASFTGNIGIGTTSPTAQLHTTGTVRFANFGAGVAEFDASGNVSSAVAFTNSVFYAADYGVIGDGDYDAGTGTDNRAAMQACIADAEAAGGCVSCPPGIIGMNSGTSGGKTYCVVVTKPIIFQGVGMAPGVSSDGNHPQFETDGATTFMCLDSGSADIIYAHGMLGPTFREFQIAGGAIFTGSISGTTLTIVGGTIAGRVGVGSRIFGVGVTAGTAITALGSGTGGAGTYTINNSQTVGSEGMEARHGGNGIRVESDLLGNNGISQTMIDRVCFYRVFNAVYSIDPTTQCIQNCRVLDWANVGVQIISSGAHEYTGGFVKNNVFFDISNYSAACVELHQGYVDVIQNNLIGSTNGILIYPDQYNAGRIYIGENSIENQSNYCIYASNQGSGILASMMQFINNEFSTTTTSNNAQIAIINGTSGGGTWLQNLQIIGNTFQSALVAGGAAFINCGAGENVQICNNALWAFGSNTAYGIYTNGNVTSPVLVADNTFTGPFAARYLLSISGNTVVRDMIGLAFANLPANAGAGSQIYVTDGRPNNLGAADYNVVGGSFGTLAVRVGTPGSAWVAGGIH